MLVSSHTVKPVKLTKPRSLNSRLVEMSYEDSMKSSDRNVKNSIHRDYDVTTLNSDSGRTLIGGFESGKGKSDDEDLRKLMTSMVLVPILDKVSSFSQKPQKESSQVCRGPRRWHLSDLFFFVF